VAIGTVANPGFIYTGTGNYVRTLSVGLGSEASATLVDDFRIIFNGDPSGYDPMILVEAGDYVPQIEVGYYGALALNDQTLIAQAGESIVWNTPYPVIENYYEDDTNIAGVFGDLVSPNPNIRVSWVDDEETGANSEVIFGYDPKGSAPAAGMRLASLGAIQNSNLIQQRSFSQLLAKHIKTQQDTLLADSGTTASDAGFLVARSGDNLENAMFIRPYAKAIDRSTSGGMGYDGNIYGFVLGYERSLSPELTLGAHAGIGFGTLDFKGDGYSDNDEDQTIYSLGVHAAYNPDAWHFDGSATFYVAEHEYDGKTGNFLEIDEDDDYTSYGAEVEVIGGYVIPSGDWAVMPYAGLGYSWINADSHSTDADDPAWDTKFGSVDEHIVRSILGAQLSGNLMWGETRVVPSLGARWEYALTDNNIEVSQSLLGSPSVTAEDDISRSSFIADASLGFSKGALSFELGGTAEYNDDYDAYGGWLTLRYAF
jgi:outer membrane autotransporter protein